MREEGKKKGGRRNGRLKWSGAELHSGGRKWAWKPKDDAGTTRLVSPSSQARLIATAAWHLLTLAARCMLLSLLCASARRRPQWVSVGSSARWHEMSRCAAGWAILSICGIRVVRRPWRAGWARLRLDARVAHLNGPHSKSGDEALEASRLLYCGG